MTRRHFFLTTLLVILLVTLISGCSSTPTPDPSIVWSDDFEDGDLEGWDAEIDQGIFSVNEGVLTGGVGVNWHESNVSFGTWSFDLFLPDIALASYDLCMGCNESWTFGFGIDIMAGKKTVISFIKLENGYQDYIEQATIDRKLTGWNHFDFTRDESGNNKIFLDGEPVLEYKDELSFEPKWFFIVTDEEGPALDNVVVRNQVIEIQPTE